MSLWIKIKENCEAQNRPTELYHYQSCLCWSWEKASGGGSQDPTLSFNLLSNFSHLAFGKEGEFPQEACGSFFKVALNKITLGQH